jgi:coproporphyrinogen III oxidase-like Fe-S oxidoreductase
MPAEQKPFSLYVHIPYCISKCPYCDFNSHVVPDIPEANYTEALIQELTHYAHMNHWRGRSVQTIFFGGGTPSTFQPSSISRVLESVSVLFTIGSDCEITLEANPGTVESANFAGYRSYGVNRISVGVQSFQPHLLKFLGRVHSADEAVKALTPTRVRLCEISKTTWTPPSVSSRRISRPTTSPSKKGLPSTTNIAAAGLAS